jgi:hypothetical protein
LIYTFKLPLYKEWKKKTTGFNLNWYRNAHYQVLNKAKQEYAPIEQELFTASRITIDYVLYWNSGRRTDLMNWISITDKFFLDWLVAKGMIKDDGFKIYDRMSARIIIDKSIQESFIQAHVEVLE